MCGDVRGTDSTYGRGVAVEPVHDQTSDGRGKRRCVWSGVVRRVRKKLKTTKTKHTKKKTGRKGPPWRWVRVRSGTADAGTMHRSMTQVHGRHVSHRGGRMLRKALSSSAHRFCIADASEATTGCKRGWLAHLIVLARPRSRGDGGFSCSCWIRIGMWGRETGGVGRCALRNQERDRSRGQCSFFDVIVRWNSPRRSCVGRHPERPVARPTAAAVLPNAAARGTRSGE